MGWGTDFKADIYLSRLKFENKGLVEDKIEELEGILDSIRQQILMYGSSNIKDVTPEDWKEEAIRFVHVEVSQLLAEYDENFKLLIDLKYYHEHLSEEKS